jgi:hypothetical protein
MQIRVLCLPLNVRARQNRQNEKTLIVSAGDAGMVSINGVNSMSLLKRANHVCVVRSGTH